MNIIKHLKNPATLVIIVLGLAGCSNDMSTRSRSYTHHDVTVPSTVVLNNQNSSSSELQLALLTPDSKVDINIDSNSYGNMRRMITQGEMPTTARLAEWVNYFNYNYPKPQGRVPLTVTTEIAPAPWHNGSQLLSIGIAASAHQSAEAPANNIVFLIDTSDNMNRSVITSLVRNSLREMADTLRPQDSVSFISYSSNPTVILEPTSGDNKSAIEKGIRNISFGHETSPSGAIQSINLAYTVLEDHLIQSGNNAVILLTNGNLHTNPNGEESIEKTIAGKNAQGLTFSALVFNTGNYNYQSMQRVTDTGGGTHAYIDTLNEARRVMHQQLNSGNQIVAQPIELQVSFNPDFVKTYRLLGYEKGNVRTIARSNNNANAMREGQTFTALYEIQMTDGELPQSEGHRFHDLGRVSVKYSLPNQPLSYTLDTSIVPPQLARTNQVSKEFSFAASVAAFALKIRKDSSVSDYSFSDIVQLAGNSTGKDELGLRHEFVWLLEAAQQLVPPEGK